MTDPRTEPASAATAIAQQARLAESFVVLADTLVADFDVADLLDLLVQTCVDVLGATAAGLLLKDHQGVLRVAASSSEATGLLEAFQIQAEEGPCLDAFHTQRAVTADLTEVASLWPTFAPVAVSLGLRSVHALPMRLRDQSIGALNLFHDNSQPQDIDLRVAQALADVATIGILHQQGARAGNLVIEQLQAALNSRVLIEQAKGVLAATGGSDMDTAFQQLRRYSRDHNAKLGELASQIAGGSLEPSLVVQWRKSAQP
jgi:GAF domain-containing protein